jgi:hypothetical protein
MTRSIQSGAEEGAAAMEHDGYQDRVDRLEAALLSRRGRTIARNAVGEVDTVQLIAEMTRLGFTFVGCEPQGFAYEAEFRRPGRDGARAQHAVASSFSEHNAILEAAIVALTHSAPHPPRDSSNPPGMSPQRVQRWFARPARGGVLGRA